MRTRSLPVRALSLTAAAAIGVSVLGGAALADAGPARAGDEFLLVQDLPRDPTWIAGEIEEGEPAIEEFCVGDVITEAMQTRHRPYATDLDTWLRQHIMTVPESKAAKLQRRLDRAVRGCAAAFEEANPGSTATSRSYGKQGTGDGVRVYGVFVEHEGALDANLFAVGRDGTDVTVVRYGRIGREADVPVKAFTKTARRAVGHLVG